MRAVDKKGMDLAGAAGDKVIDIFSTKSQNCLVLCAGRKGSLFLYEIRKRPWGGI
jgi:hypothetical protein